MPLSHGSAKPRIRVGLSRPRPSLGAPRPSLGASRPALVTPARLSAPRRLVRPAAPAPTLPSSRAQAAPSTAPEVAYHGVLYTKRSKKKRKSWLDGYIIIKNDSHVELQNEDGKRVAAERCKPLGGMKEGNTLEIGSWQLEVQNSVKEDDYISGRLFVKPSIQAVVGMPGKSKGLMASRRAPFKPLRPKNSSSNAANRAGSIGPMHDPNAPNACVLLPNVKGALGGKDSISVVLDPFLAKRMRPHQREGVKFLYKCVQGSFFMTGEGGQGAILADEMGLGKSLQAIALIWTVLKQSPRGTPSVRKAVIVCPASLVQNWVNEVKKWLGDDRLKPVQVVSGSSTFQSKEALAAFINGSVRRLLIISYEMFRSYSEQLYKSSIGLLVCDEGHRLKSSHGNKTIEALKRLPCRGRVILTGTPVQNDLGEFFSVCDFVNPACLNSLASFRTVFANPIIASRDSNAHPSAVKIGESRARELGRITSNFVLRRTSNILAKYLPSKHEVAIFCRLQQRQESAYESEARSRFAVVSNTSRFSAALSAINFLRKICCHPDLVGRGKYDSEDEDYDLPDVEEGEPDRKSILKDFQVCDSSKMQITLSICKSSLHVRDKVILVSNYTSTLDLLQEALSREGIQYCRLDGSTAVAHRGDIVRRFNDGSLGDVFLLSAKAGGVGLNLIGANRLILFDPDWNPATDLQAMARVWRDGQKKQVFVYRLLCTGTIEEKIFQRQLFKGELQSAVDGEHGGDDTEHGLEGNKAAKMMGSKEGNFSAEELRDLFKYNAKLKFCDTLEVLARSQEDALLSKDRDSPSSVTLLDRFREYQHVFEKNGGIVGEVFCGEDEVLDRALNGDLESQGLVSYLYTKKTNGEAKVKAKVEAKEEKPPNSTVRKGKHASREKKRALELQPIFESDSEEEKSSSEDDEEVQVLVAMRRSADQRKAGLMGVESQGGSKREQADTDAGSDSKKQRMSGNETPNEVVEEVQISKEMDEKKKWDLAIEEMENGLLDGFEDE